MKLRLHNTISKIDVSTRPSTIDVNVVNNRITVEDKQQTLNIENKIEVLQIRKASDVISVQQTGKRGPIGPDGPEGPPNTLSIGTVTEGDDADATITGQSPNQTLNLVLPRATPGQDGDKNYTATFSPTDNLVVTHNLNKYPAVDVINSAGDEVVGNVNYLTLNSLVVSFSAPFGGRITCN